MHGSCVWLRARVMVWSCNSLPLLGPGELSTLYIFSHGLWALLWWHSKPHLFSHPPAQSSPSPRQGPLLFATPLLCSQFLSPSSRPWPCLPTPPKVSSTAPVPPPSNDTPAPFTPSTTDSALSVVAVCPLVRFLPALALYHHHRYHLHHRHPFAPPSSPTTSEKHPSHHIRRSTSPRIKLDD